MGNITGPLTAIVTENSSSWCSLYHMKQKKTWKIGFWKWANTTAAHIPAPSNSRRLPLSNFLCSYFHWGNHIGLYDFYLINFMNIMHVNTFFKFSETLKLKWKCQKFLLKLCFHKFIMCSKIFIQHLKTLIYHQDSHNWNVSSFDTNLHNQIRRKKIHYYMVYAHKYTDNLMIWLLNGNKIIY